MAIPQTREEFKEYCLRDLGKPVIKIDVDEDQVQDRIDFALKMFADYHFDGSERIFYKYAIEANNRPDKVYDLSVASPGAGYSNTDTLTITAADGRGAGATGTITTDANGSIIAATRTATGDSYAAEPSVAIGTSTGSNGAVRAALGGYVPMPANVLGVINIFDLGSAIGVNNIFNIRYQIALNDLYTLTSVSMIPYYMAVQHIQFLELLLVGKKPLRYNRYNNRLYIDMDWNTFPADSYIIAEAYEVINPHEFTRAWSDQWLQRYATAQIKKVWGTNLKKFGNLPMPGGVVFNGQTIYDEAVADIKQMESELINTYSLPAVDMIG